MKLSTLLKDVETLNVYEDVEVERVTDNNKNNLDACIQKNNYTIRPIEISDNTPLIDIKNNIEPGSIFSLNINSQVRKELSTIIIYIKSKGYNIDNLENHLLE
jgi:SepF-like predicted cell division protein (DUF552 family)